MDPEKDQSSEPSNPGPDPFESLSEVHRRAPEIRVIVLSAYVRDRYLDAAVEAGADVNAKDYLGQTPLEWAAKYASPESVKTLIKAGADVNVGDDHGSTALMQVARFQENAAATKVLLDDGAEPILAYFRGEAPAPPTTEPAT